MVWLLAGLMAAMLVPGQLSAAQPEGMMDALGNKGFSPGEIGDISIAISPDGTPYVVFSDKAYNNGTATVMKYNGTQWEIVGNRGLTNYTISKPSIKFDSNGIPHVAFLDLQYSNKVTVMKLNGNQWEPVGKRGFTEGHGNYLSFVIANDNTPYVAFSDGGKSWKATVMKFEQNNWVLVGERGFSAGQSNYVSLAVDSKGTPYVGYSLNYGAPSVKKFVDGNWVNVADLTSEDISGLSLAFDGNDTLYAMYFAYSYRVYAIGPTVKKLNGSSWELVGVENFADDIARQGSLAIGNDGTLYAAFVDQLYGSKATVMKFNGEEWEAVGTRGFSDGSINFVDGVQLAVDRNGVPYVAYKDTANGNKATVTKFAKSRFSVEASAALAEPETGENDEITLTVKNEAGRTDTTFKGTANVTVTGYGQAPDGTYGSFADTELTAGSTTVPLEFEDGVAKANLALHKAMPQTVTFSVYGAEYPESNPLILAPVAGAAKAMVLTRDIEAPSSSGRLFAQQPIVTLLDAYGNIATGNNVTEVTASKKDDGRWTLTGTVTVKAKEGVVTFTDLGAKNSARVNGARIAFHADGLPEVTSRPVTLRAPDTPSSAPSQPEPGPDPAPETPAQPSDEASEEKRNQSPEDEARQSPEQSPEGSAEQSPEETPEPPVSVFNTDVVNVVELIRRISAKAEEAQTGTAPEFADTRNHWADNAIGIFAMLDLAGGYEDGTFRPDQPITRAEVAALLHRVFAIRGGGETGTTLRDIEGHWAQGAIEALVAAGVVSGYPDGTFRPDQPITREEMVVLLSRLVNLGELAKDETKGQFADTENSYAADKIRAAAQAGIASGKGDHRFDPKSNATRAEALQMILNVLTLHPELKALLESLAQ